MRGRPPGPAQTTPTVTPRQREVARLVAEHYGTYPVSRHELALIGERRVDILDLIEMDIVQSFATSPPEAADEPQMADRKPAIR